MAQVTSSKERVMQISNLHRFASSYYGGEGWAAEVASDAGRLVVSKYDDEQRWIAVGFYAPSCDWFPVYWNGEGSRCTLLKVPTDEVQTALDAAVLQAS
jgi:hypothetical protein